MKLRDGVEWEPQCAAGMPAATALPGKALA